MSPPVHTYKRRVLNTIKIKGSVTECEFIHVFILALPQISAILCLRKQLLYTRYLEYTPAFNVEGIIQRD